MLTRIIQRMFSGDVGFPELPYAGLFRMIVVLTVIVFTSGAEYSEAQNFSQTPDGPYLKERSIEIRFDRADQIEHIKKLTRTKRKLMRLEIETQLQEQALEQTTETPEATEITSEPEPNLPTATAEPTPEPVVVEEEPQPVQTGGSWYGAGAAAYYAQSFDYGGWEEIYWLQATWGNQALGAIGPSPEGYHCVHADIDLVGIPITLSANGVTITCITADTVQVDHKWQWHQSWAIELSWTAFVDLGLDANNYVEVYLP